MLALTKDQITYLLKALVEHKTKLERMRPYPKQKNDLRPYNDLIKVLVKYRRTMQRAR